MQNAEDEIEISAGQTTMEPAQQTEHKAPKRKTSQFAQRAAHAPPSSDRHVHIDFD
jgi:hypothetical protein